jgi:hypothetical protein
VADIIMEMSGQRSPKALIIEKLGPDLWQRRRRCCRRRAHRSTPAATGGYVLFYRVGILTTSGQPFSKVWAHAPSTVIRLLARGVRL